MTASRYVSMSMTSNADAEGRSGKDDFVYVARGDSDGSRLVAVLCLPVCKVHCAANAVDGTTDLN